MPTYEYVCADCGHPFEAFQSIKDDPLTDCPKCGKSSAKRQISLGAGFVLKGGGWYSDLYGSSKSGASGESAGEGASTSSGTDKGSGDSSGASDSTGSGGSGGSSSSGSSDD